MLENILTHKRYEVAALKAHFPIKDVAAAAARARKPRNVLKALRVGQPALIAEVKRRSPSCGVLREPFKPVELARTYQNGGAHMISVLADELFFGGSCEIVASIATDPEINLPVLYKEFVVDPYQVYQARAAGADAVLLIVRAVTPSALYELVTLTRRLGMEPLVEIFSPDELPGALAPRPRLVGINNRDLKSFSVDTGRAAWLRTQLPYNVLAVSESGLRTRDDVVAAGAAGFGAVLVGETLLRASDPAAKARELLGLSNR